MAIVAGTYEGGLVGFEAAGEATSPLSSSSFQSFRYDTEDLQDPSAEKRFLWERSATLTLHNVFDA